MGASIFTARLMPNSEEVDVITMCAEDFNNDPVPKRCIEDRDKWSVWAAARSQHSGGVNASNADGSVRFIADQIEPSVYRGISTIVGGETVAWDD
jgi:hypothetical protein